MELTKFVFQILFWTAGGIASVFSAVAIVRAARQYRRGLRQRTAESLMELEERFETLRDILPLVDPESRRYHAELRMAVQKSIEKVPQEKRHDEERERIQRLDKFLRFLLLLTTLEKYELLDRNALDYMYWYWFAAIRYNKHLRGYVNEYFPTLASAIEDRPLERPLDREQIAARWQRMFAEDEKKALSATAVGEDDAGKAQDESVQAKA